MFFGMSFLVNACALAKKVVTLHPLFGVTAVVRAEELPRPCCAGTTNNI